MDCRRDTKRANIEVDRLSSLPDDLIHKILSLNGLKHAIGMSVLSSRWRYIWTSIPFLDFTPEDFSTSLKFSAYVTNVLSRRNNLIQVFSVKLRFCGEFNHTFVERIMSYAFSHNIQQLNVTCVLDNFVQLPLSLFTSQSLRHLTLTSELIDGSLDTFMKSYSLETTSTLWLPALTTLYLGNITLCCNDNSRKSVDFFSNCPNLKSITLNSVKTMGLCVLDICHPLLSDLTLNNVQGSVYDVNVVAPELKNLTICNCSSMDKELKYRICAPDLSSLCYTGYHPLRLFTNDLSSLEKVDLGVYGRKVTDANWMFRLLQQLKSVKFLTISLEIVEVLSSSEELISDQPSPFTNLKMLKIYPKLVDSKENVSISEEVKNYLLDGSPSATFTMVSSVEEIMAKRNTELAQKCMENLWVGLEREKAQIETNMAHINRGKTPMESDKAKTHEQDVAQLEYLVQIEETHIDACWEDFSRQIENGKSKISDIISELHDIKKLIAKLPTVNRTELEPCFSSLCSEADIVVNKIMDCVKILCDMKGNRFSVYIHGLATKSLPCF
ncbi:F-box domain containing protein [Tanacetum coccineum]